MIATYTQYSNMHIVWPFLYSWSEGTWGFQQLKSSVSSPSAFEHSFTSFHASYCQSLIGALLLWPQLHPFAQWTASVLLPSTRNLVYVAYNNTHLMKALHKFYMYPYLLLQPCTLSILASCCSRTFSEHFLSLLRSVTEELERNYIATL